MKKHFWMFLVVLSFVGVVIGAEANAPAKEESGSLFLVIASHLTDLILGVLTLLFGWLIKLAANKANMDQATRDAMDALAAGVEAAWLELGKKFKEAAGDGKMSDDEKKQLRELAWKKAKECASSDGAKVLAKWGMNIAFAKIKDIVTKRKKDDAAILAASTSVEPVK